VAVWQSHKTARTAVDTNQQLVRSLCALAHAKPYTLMDRTKEGDPQIIAQEPRGEFPTDRMAMGQPVVPLAAAPTPMGAWDPASNDRADTITERIPM